MAQVEEARQVVIGTHVIPYTLKVSTRAKRLRVTVAEGKVSVTVPKGLRLYSVDGFLRENGQWILEKMAQVRHVNARLERRVEDADACFGRDLAAVDGELRLAAHAPTSGQPLCSR